MSLYNMVNKVNPAAFFMLPLLEVGHPDDWPRFRDCFVTPHRFQIVNDLPLMLPIDEKEKPNGIYVLLRIGGGNRDAYLKPWNTILRHPNYVRDWDDEFDSTFAHVQYTVPDKWKDDYDKAVVGNWKDTSPEYKALLYQVYPKLKATFDKLFE